eukprot:TRINITY_DN2994_c0_g1_i1.p1 TRINITY_DN2994_c0_g1~~TRINITY_DN2994_c0_g1_i1.p1  ORF type:complete len:479 (-),score=224.33 TRINITY_DN2994_c0_g1_i1:281-1717(-)
MEPVEKEETPIVKRPKLTPPSLDDHKAALRLVQDEIERKREEVERLFKEREAAFEQLKSKQEQKSGTIDEFKKVKAEFDSAKEKKAVAYDRMTQTVEIAKRIEEELREMKQQVHFRSAGEAEKRISELERHMEDPDFSRVEEKKTLHEIREVRSVLPLFAQIEQKGEDLKKAKDIMQSARDDLRVKNDALKKFRDALDEVYERRQAEFAKSGAAAVKIVKREDIQKVRDEISALFEKKKQMNEDYNRRRDEYRKELRRIQEEKRAEYLRKVKEEEEARKLAYEEQKRKVEDFKRKNPFIKELRVAATLIGRLTPLVPVEKEEEKKKGRKKSGKGYDPEDEWMMGSEQSSKKKGKKRSQKTKKNVNLPIEVIAGISEMKMAVPTTLDEIKACLEELLKKKAEWESFKPADEEPAEEEAKKIEEEKEEDKETKTEEGEAVDRMDSKAVLEQEIKDLEDEVHKTDLEETVEDDLEEGEVVE